MTYSRCEGFRMNRRLFFLVVLLFLLVLPLLFVSCTKHESPPTTEQLERRVRDILQLDTVEYLYREVVYLGEERRFLFFQTVNKEVLFAVDLVARAGIDLEKGVEIMPDQSNPRRLYVRLPAATVTGVDAREETIEQYFVHERGDRIQWLEFSDAVNETKAELRRRAIEDGILAGAESNARTLLANAVRAAGFEQVEISFENRGLEL